MSSVIFINLISVNKVAPFRLKSPFLDVAKLIAAYMTNIDVGYARQVADGPWWQVMGSTFQDSPTKLVILPRFFLFFFWFLQPESLNTAICCRSIKHAYLSLHCSF